MRRRAEALLGWIPPPHFESTVLRERGLNDPAILEIVHIVGFFNYINRLASALGVDPEPEWTR